MDNENLCSKVLIKERIKLEPQYLTHDFQKELNHRLRQKVEGQCTKHGYIRKGSIDIYKIIPGKVELVGLNGFTVYDIYFYADVCNPLIGSVINRFGILADVKLSEGNHVNSVIEIIVAKNSVNIVSEIDLENIKVGDEINVEVVGKKFNLGDKRISVIGRIVKEPSSKITSSKFKIAEGGEEEEDNEENVENIEEEDEEDETSSKDDEEEKAEADEPEEEEEALDGGSENFFNDDDEEEEDVDDFEADDLLSGDEGVISEVESI